MTTPTQLNARPDVRPNESDDRYLWDRSGAPDPLVERLETLLAPSRLQRAGDFDALIPRRSTTWELHRMSWIAGIAASLLVALSIGAWFIAQANEHGRGWEVAAVDGRPRVDGTALRVGRVLPIGAWLETDEQSTASVRVATIGDLDVLAGSRVRIKETADNKHEVELAHGHIRARILAPPRLFFVQTRAALATDMGCRYDLEMPKSGPGLLSVTLGWVLLEGTKDDGWSARVPAGHSCVIDSERGPGTPFRGGASYESLLRTLDQRGWAGVSDDEFATLMEGCGHADAVTLWHLLHRVDESRRPAVLERLRGVLERPSDLSRAEILALEADAMERLWGEAMWAR